MSLVNCAVAASGTHKGYAQAKIEKLVTDNGGSFSKSVEQHTTHLVTTTADVEKKSNKVLQAQNVKAKLVSLEWLTESIEQGKRADEAQYLLGFDKAACPTASPEPEPAKTKRTRGAAVVQIDPEPETDEELKPPAKKAKTVPVKGKAKGKGKATVVKDEKEDEEEEEEEKEEEKDEEKGKEKEAKMKTVVKKGKAPVDELSNLGGTHHVYVDGDGVVYDACLNQTQIASNNNKFYYIQLLESDSGKLYATFTHWGRVGERGQSKMLCHNANLVYAEAQFNKQFKAKTGFNWIDRDHAHGGANKYAYLARNYEDDEDEEEDTKPSSTAETVKIPDSTIEKPLQELVKLIFNTTYMQQSMASLSYDANKLPLGKLSKDTILRGYAVLKEIGDVILNGPNNANKRQRLMELSSRYYTVIPHDFGRNTPHCIDTPQILKRETELVENLSDMKITAEIMASTKDAHDIHPLDKQFQSLGLNEAVPLDHKSKEYKLLEAYLHKTHGSTHYMSLKVEEIFRITRDSEDKRWVEAGMDKLTNLGDNRKLLWHGSRTTNFSGILSQGLRIAPPEAPVSGYMFDKGIYLADIATKSANYCVASISNNTGLLLLCEAQLGDPMLEMTNADYHAATKCKQAGRLATKGLGRTAPTAWEDASVVHERLKGVQMPKVSGKEKNITGPASVSGASLQYNEYIVYDVAQVKIRYMFRCHFG